MPQLNPDKAYAQQPQRLGVDASVIVPADWLAQLGDIVAATLEWDNQKKAELNNSLNFHAGTHSTYSLKVQLLNSLKIIYGKFINPATSLDQKGSIAAKLEEGAANCTPGFHDRCNELVASFTTPRNLDESLQVQREWIVAQARTKATDEVHANNRFTMVARNLGYGVRPLNEGDVSGGALTDQVIGETLKAAFDAHYTLFHVLNSLCEQIQAIVRERGYTGRKASGYTYEDYCKFDNDYLKDFVSLHFREFFHLEEEDEDGDVLMQPRVLDINWANVKKALFKKIIDEQYFTMSPQENSLLAVMRDDGESFIQLPQEGLSLFTTPDELIQSLVFFKEWPVAKKVNLVAYYFKDKSLDEKKEILKKLSKIPDLIAKLQTTEPYQSIYLTMAAKADDLEKVHALVEQGGDVNPVLGLLFAKAKYETLWWLHQQPEMRDKITQAGMESLIPEGKHQGETVRELLTSSKKGCQLLRQDNRLQGLCPDLIDGKPITDYLNEKTQTIQSSQKGFFKPFVHPKVKAFLQHVINGGMKEAEKILKDHKDDQAMFRALLTTKAIVTDFAGRRIEGASLQLALGAKDVSPYEHEEMAEMLEGYLKTLPDGEAEIEKQKAEQFPEGWERQEEARKRADSDALKTVFAKIKAANTDATLDAAVTEFKEYLAKQKEGVLRTGFHFNDQLFQEACERYDDHYTVFGGYDSKKIRLAAIKVIGGIECLFTANLAQAACDGFGNVVEKKVRLTRSLKLSSPADYPFFHPDLGKSHFVYSYYGAAFAPARGPLCFGSSVMSHAELMSSKNIKLAETYAVTISPASNAVAACAMM